MRPTVRCLLLALCFSCTHSAAHHLLNLNHELALASELKNRMGEQDSVQKPNRKILQAATEADKLMAEAIRRGNYTEVKRLLNEGANPNYILETTDIAILTFAVMANRDRILTLFLRRGADVEGPPGSSTREYGPLHTAALFDAPTSTKILLNAGLPIDRFNSDGYAPLHIAARKGSTRAAIVLLDEGAPIEQRSRTSATPLLYAAFNGYLSIVSLLLSREADVHSSTKYGNTALHEAAMANHKLIIQKLLDNGANIDAQASGGETPLFYASVLGNQGAIKILLKNQADKSIEAFGSTPREALCTCVNSTDVLDECNVNECGNTQKMLELLT